MEEEGFMTYSAASHQGAIETLYALLSTAGLYVHFYIQPLETNLDQFML